MQSPLPSSVSMPPAVLPHDHAQTLSAQSNCPLAQCLHLENALELAYDLDMRDTARMDTPIWKEWRVMYDPHTAQPFVLRPPGAVELPKTLGRSRLTSALAACLHNTLSASCRLQTVSSSNKLRSDGIMDLMRPPPSIPPWPTYGLMDLITTNTVSRSS